MAGKNGQHQDELLASALACGHTLTDAARQAGISERTARRRKADPEFSERVRELRRGFTEKAFATVERSATAAAVTLAELCRKSSSEKIKLGAAKCLLELAFRFREHTDLRDRLEQVERMLAERAELEQQLGTGHQRYGGGGYGDQFGDE